ncbi:hypothetical protein SAMN04515674_11041 [Pseudarcicella hirudinis]|uniref:Uncharacterized protein n=1 Tax=Pseudarcicella hirudinis TaxID=1079859 RepID=A0A1I5VSQ9_9BACT|nr:hypothetical protein [Pseudarcicella hirudinis]SFQ10529.1 hypothetical protein SAMN04515674_11041 [Pseudarcicella hirudinis]
MMPFFLYIDPSSGSMLFQAIIASVLGGLMFFKQLKFKLTHIFSKKEEQAEKENVAN